MKILILSFYYHPDLSAGSFRTKALVDRFLQQGANIEIITTMPNRYTSFKPDALKTEISDMLSIHRIALPSHKSGMLDQVKAFLRYYQDSKLLVAEKDYDLVFATSSRLFTAFLGARIARKKNIPLYLDIRDIFTDSIVHIIPKAINWIAIPILKLIEKYAFNSAKRINIVSRGFLELLENRYQDLDYRFFTNGIDNEFIELENTKNFYNTSNNSNLNILYAGNIGAGQCLHKIVPNLAEAMQDTVFFKVIGDGGQITKLKEIIETKNIKNVELLAPIDRRSLITEYMKADILFMHLDNQDCFKRVLPSKIFEYAATGKPILAGLSGYSEKFIKSEIENCEVFEPGNVDMAIKKLNQLKIKTTSRDKFIRTFSRDKIMKDMVDDIYKCYEEYC